MAEKVTYIDTPVKEGYIFSHWSKYKPGSYTKVRDSKGNIVNLKNQCPPFDFEREVITNDITLYAIFVPEVKATFVTYDSDTDTSNVEFEETTTSGSLIYDPVEEGKYIKYESSTKDEDSYSGTSDTSWVYKIDSTTKKATFNESENITYDR